MDVSERAVDTRDSMPDLAHIEGLRLSCRGLAGPERQYVALDIVLNVIAEMYVLSGKEYFRCIMTCSKLMKYQSAVRVFVGWLTQQEGGRGCQHTDVKCLYEEYHYARTMRCFLRSVSIMHNVTIAGSYPAGKYLEEQRLDAWAPNDIDIFVAHRSDFDLIAERCIECLTKQCNFKVNRTEWEGFGFPYPSQDSDHSAVGTDGDTDSHTGTDTTDEDGTEIVTSSPSHSANQDIETDIAQGPSPLSPGHATHHNAETDQAHGPSPDLARHISEWVARQRNSRLLGHIALDHPNAVRALAVCAEAVHHLPNRTSRGIYAPVATARLRPFSYLGAFRFVTTPRVTPIPINLIMCHTLQGRPVPDDWPAAVCSGFDITLCAVSLSVQKDHSLQLREHEDAYSVLRFKRLSLSGTAFSGPDSMIPAQMTRILKYALRGCAW